MLDRISKAVQRANPRIPSPRKNESPCASQTDELVVDEVRCHSDQGQVPPALADDLMPRREGDQMREPFHRDGPAVLDEFGNRI